MGKLVERLHDVSRSGVYRARSVDVVLDAAHEGKLDVAEVDLSEAPALTAIAKALDFPDWFGNNWDALEDCLGDLSWRNASGHVIVFARHEKLPKDDLGVLIDVLKSSAEFWAERGAPFFAVFIDPPRALSLPDLYREA